MTLREDPVVREKLAALAHEMWSGWMHYLFDKCAIQHDHATIPAWAVRHWQRQMNTAYCDLSDEEKESDRRQADKMLAIVEETRCTGPGHSLNKPPRPKVLPTESSIQPPGVGDK